MDKYYPFYLSVDQDALKIKSELIEDENIVAFFDSRNIICEDQIRTAMYRATRSFKSNKAIANQFNVELMLHLSGTHQIKIAIGLFDVQSHTKEIITINRSGTENIENSNQGFPSFNPSREVLDKLRIKSKNNACKEIISLGARLVTDYE